jgi:CHAT domain-containing protein
LWQVDDELTSELMSRFYSELKSGTQKIEALNRAQTAIRQKNPNPYYWAGFVLVGGPDLPGK